jgi:hypothetical protein
MQVYALAAVTAKRPEKRTPIVTSLTSIDASAQNQTNNFRSSQSNADDNRDDRIHKPGSINLIVARIAFLLSKVNTPREKVSAARRMTMKLFLENIVATCLLLIVLLKLARTHPPRSRQNLADGLIH